MERHVKRNHAYGWLLLRVRPPQRKKETYAIEPVDDLEPHDTYSASCRCDPIVKVHLGRTTVIHNAFDGRELVEEYGLM